jgi:hypothetical protein
MLIAVQATKVCKVGNQVMITNKMKIPITIDTKVIETIEIKLRHPKSKGKTMAANIQTKILKTSFIDRDI